VDKGERNCVVNVEPNRRDTLVLPVKRQWDHTPKRAVGLIPRRCRNRRNSNSKSGFGGCPPTFSRARQQIDAKSQENLQEKSRQTKRGLKASGTIRG
jgi:hypothetical protein